MDYVIIAFRSRTHTIKFAEELRKRGIPSEIVNTPKQAYVGCGLSVKVNKRYFPIAKRFVVRFVRGIFYPAQQRQDREKRVIQAKKDCKLRRFMVK